MKYKLNKYKQWLQINNIVLKSLGGDSRYITLKNGDESYRVYKNVPSLIQISENYINDKNNRNIMTLKYYNNILSNLIQETKDIIKQNFKKNSFMKHIFCLDLDFTSENIYKKQELKSYLLKTNEHIGNIIDIISNILSLNKKITRKVRKINHDAFFKVVFEKFETNFKRIM